MEKCAANGGARIIREPGKNFNRKFTIHNTDTRFDKMYKLILSLKILSIKPCRRTTGGSLLFTTGFTQLLVIAFSAKLT
jgi:hypothetical protein